MSEKIAILGDGGWGTALALTLHRAGHGVAVWGPFPDYIERVRREGENPLYLPGVPLPGTLSWTADRAEAVEAADVVILATPSKFYRAVVESFRGLVPERARLVSVAKGLDPGTAKRLTEVAAEIFGRPAAALSGPSHAEEVAREIPTAVVLAAGDLALAEDLQAVFMAPRFRVYTSTDTAGVELGGALKNIIAIGVGVSDGLGFGDNTRAALITRGLAELARMGRALGARAETFAGLSGMGDLIVTCTSRHSRNRAVGERLGKGETLDAILGGMKQVAEGVSTCAVARQLAARLGVAAPIIREVFAVLHEGKNPHEAVQSLLAREGRPEHD
ncbi:MAG: NAD(P)-dependent glycerol-3-phosphate dehydrogenase [Kiritimatiellae bacterium]|nr:NAD(P)-dependent glycerol-3-phosphate dehydrogenase [Kiritimatiellia bacterium]